MQGAASDDRTETRPRSRVIMGGALGELGRIRTACDALTNTVGDTQLNASLADASGRKKWCRSVRRTASPGRPLHAEFEDVRPERSGCCEGRSAPLEAL
jgi:hypothetical protein